MKAAAQHKRLRVAIERMMVRADADAMIAVSTHEESVFVRVNVMTKGSGSFFCTDQLEVFFFTHLSCTFHSLDSRSMGVERET